jgi:hypothetical protein
MKDTYITNITQTDQLKQIIVSIFLWFTDKEKIFIISPSPTLLISLPRSLNQYNFLLPYSLLSYFLMNVSKQISGRTKRSPEGYIKSHVGQPTFSCLMWVRLTSCSLSMFPTSTAPSDITLCDDMSLTIRNSQINSYWIGELSHIQHSMLLKLCCF